MSEDKHAFVEQMKHRTKEFARQIIDVYRLLPKTGEAKILGNQLLRSGSSVGANYRATCRARSNAEYFSKLSITVEEADETLFWLELIEESEILSSDLIKPVKTENQELLSILAKARKNSKS
jgi:four helix bundle protein